MIKTHQWFVLFLFVSIFSAKAQDSDYVDPTGIYIQPIYSVDVIASNDLDPSNNYNFLFLGLNLNGFQSYGTEVGYYKGEKSYGVQLKYGQSVDHEKLRDYGNINGQKHYNYFLNVGLVANGRIVGTKTRSHFQFQLGFRGSLGYYFYSGEKYIKNDTHPNGKVKSINDHAGGIEFGPNLKIGFRPTNKKAILFVIEPFNLQLNTVGVGAGGSRIGISVQL